MKEMIGVVATQEPVKNIGDLMIMISIVLRDGVGITLKLAMNIEILLVLSWLYRLHLLRLLCDLRPRL